MAIGINISNDDEGTMMFRHWLEDDNINQKTDKMTHNAPKHLCSVCEETIVPKKGAICENCFVEDDDVLEDDYDDGDVDWDDDWDEDDDF